MLILIFSKHIGLHNIRTVWVKCENIYYVIKVRKLFILKLSALVYLAIKMEQCYKVGYGKLLDFLAFRDFLKTCFYLSVYLYFKSQSSQQLNRCIVIN